MKTIPKIQDESKCSVDPDERFLQYKRTFDTAGFAQIPRALLNGAARELLGLTCADEAICRDLRRRQINGHPGESLRVKMEDIAKATGYTRKTIWTGKEHLLELELIIAPPDPEEGHYQRQLWNLLPLWNSISDATGEPLSSMFGKDEYKRFLIFCESKDPHAKSLSI